MQEHRAAAAGDPRGGVVVDLDNEIVEVILARQAVTLLGARQADRLIVVAVGGIFAPGIFNANRADRQEGFWTAVTVGAPP